MILNRQAHKIILSHPIARRSAAARDTINDGTPLGWAEYAQGEHARHERGLAESPRTFARRSSNHEASTLAPVQRQPVSGRSRLSGNASVEKITGGSA